MTSCLTLKGKCESAILTQPPFSIVLNSGSQSRLRRADVLCADKVSLHWASMIPNHTLASSNVTGVFKLTALAEFREAGAVAEQAGTAAPDPAAAATDAPTTTEIQV